MSPIVFLALESITARTNLATGLAHPNDKNAAKEMLLLLHQAGEILIPQEIKNWCESNEWSPRDARELALLAAQISVGSRVKIVGGPSWQDDILDQFRARAVAENSAGAVAANQ